MGQHGLSVHSAEQAVGPHVPMQWRCETFTVLALVTFMGQMAKHAAVHINSSVKDIRDATCFGKVRAGGQYIQAPNMIIYLTSMAAGLLASKVGQPQNLEPFSKTRHKPKYIVLGNPSTEMPCIQGLVAEDQINSAEQHNSN